MVSLACTTGVNGMFHLVLFQQLAGWKYQSLRTINGQGKFSDSTESVRFNVPQSQPKLLWPSYADSCQTVCGKRVGQISRSRGGQPVVLLPKIVPISVATKDIQSRNIMG
jgi:hypothetical protein